MRNINLVKVANVIAIFVMFALVLTPFFAAAVYKVPDATGGGGTGLPNESNATAIIFRYITAGGNEETAETAKKTITNAIIGIVVIILAFVIVRVISNALLPATNV